MNTPIKLGLAAILLAALACSFPSIRLGVPTSSLRGSDDIVTVEENVSGFDRLDIRRLFDVEIVQGQTFSLVIQVNDNVEEYLIVEQRGDTLVLDLEDGRIYNNITLEAQISMPDLRSLKLSGASDASFTEFASAEPLDLEVSGASSADGEIEAGDVDIKISGASSVELRGSGGDLVLDVSGASEADLDGFTVNDARLDLSGASDAMVNVSGILDVRASGASNVTYEGDPRLGTIQTSGSSNVEGK